LSIDQLKNNACPYIIEYTHNKFISEICDILNKLLVKYKELYNEDFKFDDKIINCDICYSHTLNNPVITYYDKKYKDIEEEKYYKLSRSYRKK